jgi:23S rRNA (adenine2503-C2)-methyltransferase
MKKDILDLTFSELECEIQKLNLPVFRVKQIFAGLHKYNNNKFYEIKGISKEIATTLESKFFIPESTMIKKIESEIDKTLKFLFSVGEHKNVITIIESVLISDKARNTICVSTQAGCNAGCEFCATGKMGFVRNLKSSEIVMQIYNISKICSIKPTNIVFMGMGEPFLNYKNFIRALKILTNKNGFGIPSSKITISTIGIKGMLKKFADDIMNNDDENLSNTKLAISLHSTNNGIREKIIPLSKKYNLKNVYDDLIYLYRKTKNKITYEYIYFNRFNDTENDIKRIVKLSKMIPCNFNVINFHPVNGALIEPLDIIRKKMGIKKSLLYDDLNNFIEKLRNYKVVVNLRNSSGVDINAACGQLAVNSLTQNSNE